MKRGIFIHLLLQAYSQEIFIPTEIYGTGCSKDDFVEEVSAVLINNIAEDDRAIRREVRNQYNEISF